MRSVPFIHGLQEADQFSRHVILPSRAADRGAFPILFDRPDSAGKLRLYLNFVAPETLDRSYRHRFNAA